MTYDPALYCVTHTGNAGDVDYYLKMCPRGSDVLELGCGYGRIALPLVSKGVFVTGLDSHAGMLNMLTETAKRLSAGERDRLHTFRGDMRCFDLDRRFDRVIIPYNGLLCLLSDRDVVRCLERASQHLTTDGEIIFDIYDVPFFENGQSADDEFELITTVTDRGRTIDIYERTLPHTDPRRLDTAYRYDFQDENGNDQSVIHIIKQRCIYADDLPALLYEAGLRTLSITGDFKEELIHEDTGQVVVRAQVA